MYSKCAYREHTMIVLYWTEVRFFSIINTIIPMMCTAGGEVIVCIHEKSRESYQYGKRDEKAAKCDARATCRCMRCDASDDNRHREGELYTLCFVGAQN